MNEKIILKIHKDGKPAGEINISGMPVQDIKCTIEFQERKGRNCSIKRIKDSN